MKNTLNNTVYYIIVNKDKLDFIIPKKDEKLETLQANYVLNNLLNQLGIPNSPIYRTQLGKPYFKKQNIFFNYSHSKNYIACAVSSFNVGIDIEETDRIINDTMVKVCEFNPNTKLEELVKREAYCKLTGNGLAMFFNKNNFRDINHKSMNIKNKEYICSICSDCPNPVFQSTDIK